MGEYFIWPKRKQDLFQGKESSIEKKRPAVLLNSKVVNKA